MCIPVQEFKPTWLRNCDKSNMTHEVSLLFVLGVVKNQNKKQKRKIHSNIHPYANITPIHLINRHNTRKCQILVLRWLIFTLIFWLIFLSNIWLSITDTKRSVCDKRHQNYPQRSCFVLVLIAQLALSIHTSTCSCTEKSNVNSESVACSNTEGALRLNGSEHSATPTHHPLLGQRMMMIRDNSPRISIPRETLRPMPPSLWGDQTRLEVGRKPERHASDAGSGQYVVAQQLEVCVRGCVWRVWMQISCVSNVTSELKRDVFRFNSQRKCARVVVVDTSFVSAKGGKTLFMKTFS